VRCERGSAGQSDSGAWGVVRCDAGPGSLSSCHTARKLAVLMLDTLRVRGAWRLKTALPGRRKVSLKPCVKVWGDSLERVLEMAECSLPKLLFGHNGRVLENQDQLDAALAKLREVLGTIADVPDISEWEPWRVDIAWNFDRPVRPLVLAHAALRVRGIQREGTLHPGYDGVSWRGAKSRFMVTFYDKARQMRVPGSVLRAEVSLRGEQLARRLHGGDWHDFSALWRTYRNIMASLPAIERTAEARGWQEAIGPEPPEVRQRILARLAHKPSGTFRRYRRRIEAAAAQLPGTFSWADILPVDGPPPPVNVQPPRLNQGRGTA